MFILYAWGDFATRVLFAKGEEWENTIVNLEVEMTSLAVLVDGSACAWGAFAEAKREKPGMV